MMHKLIRQSYWKIVLIVAALLLITRPATGAVLGFGQEDYTQFEDRGFVSVEVTKLQTNNERIVVSIAQLTFDQFARTPGLVLPPELVPIVDSVDPAELDGTRNDFDDSIQQVIFEPSQGISEQIVTINLVDDIINEAQEGFYVMMNVTESGLTDQITLVRNGIALIRINDNDPITIGFSQIQYSVQEDSGVFQPEPVAIVKEASRASEQVLNITVDFIDITAVSGADYTGSSALLTLRPEDASIPISLSVMSDVILEDNEIFLGSLSIPVNPPSGLGPSTTASTTTITILDDEAGAIGFVQPSYSFREGVDTTAEVCFRILSPPQDEIDPIAVFALINVDPFENSAQVNEDYAIPAGYQSSALLDASTIEECRSVDLINDDQQEGIESFLFRLTLSGGIFDVIGNFQVTVPVAEVVILDDDAPSDIVVEFDPVVYGPVTEGSQQSVIFRVIAQSPPTQQITVLFSTINGNATAPVDFAAREDLLVVFGVGETEQFVEVGIENDDVYENELEEFEAVLTLPPGSSGVLLGQQSQAMASIQDDDEVTVLFEPLTYSVLEGEAVGLLIRLIGQADTAIHVNFQTRDGTASAPEDYTATFDTITFNPGETNQSVLVSTVVSALVETNEVFEGVLALLPGSQRITLGNDVAMVTIIDTSSKFSLPKTVVASNPDAALTPCAVVHSPSQPVTTLFLTPSPTINAIEGDIIEITCGPLGPEEITIEVNGVATPLLFQDSNMQRVYTFGPVNRTQQGTVFQCFSGGQSSSAATLQVFYPPQYTFLAMYEGNEGDPLTITLGLDGNPLPPDVFTWTFNAQPLELEGNVIILNETTIVFSSLNRNNTGVYSVSATNLAGSGRADFSLAVFYPPEYNIGPSFTINEGGIFNLSSLNLDANPIPRSGNFSWIFNGQPLMDRPGLIELGVDFILLTSVSRNQSGVYMITSSNRAGTGQTSFALNVNYPPTYTVDQRFTPIEGGPFRVDLGLDANPIPGIGMFEWTFNGQLISLQLPGVGTGVNFLDFGNNIRREASGNYTVASFNEAGSGNASFVIDVYYSPVYSINSTIFSIIQGETFDLELDLDANPFPQNASWFFNGQLLPLISGIELGVNFIRIQMVTQLDAGVYTVQTSNAAGTGMISFMLQVEVPTTAATAAVQPTPTATITPSITNLAVDRTRVVISPTPSPDDTGMGLGGDPHFSVLLPNGQLLCFSIQGEHGFVFSLISNKILHMNAKFISDSKRSEVTWIGSLGIVVRSKKANTSKIRFEASNNMVYVDDKISLNAHNVKKLTLANGKLSVTESDQTVRKNAHTQVQVDLHDVGITFTVYFVKDHIDMVWNKVRKQPKDSHGIIGQFFRDEVEIDELRQLLLLPGMDPVAVMRKPVWHFMEREEKEDQLCWVAMNPGYQGKKLIQGHYLDYVVNDVLSSSLKFRPGKDKRKLEKFLYYS